MYRVTKILAVISVVLATASCAQAQHDGSANAPKAFIALTYDDSMASHLDYVIPALDEAGLVGTFYLTIEKPEFLNRQDEWAMAAKSGHELGNHTLFRPCSGGPGREWVRDGADLRTYNIDRMVQEVALTNGILETLDGKPARSFAYPCGETELGGGQTYVDAIAPRVSGARGVQREPVYKADGSLDTMRISTFAVNDHSGADLIAYAQSVADAGGIGTFTFHGVGEPHLEVSEQAHGELIAWLKANDDRVSVVTVDGFIQMN